MLCSEASRTTRFKRCLVLTWSSRVYFYKPKLAAITYKNAQWQGTWDKNSTEHSRLRIDNLNRKPDPKSIEHVRLLPSEFSQTQEWKHSGIDEMKNVFSPSPSDPKPGNEPIRFRRYDKDRNQRNLSYLLRKLFGAILYDVMNLILQRISLGKRNAQSYKQRVIPTCCIPKQ